MCLVASAFANIYNNRYKPSGNGEAMNIKISSHVRSNLGVIRMLAGLQSVKLYDYYWLLVYRFKAYAYLFKSKQENYQGAKKHKHDIFLQREKRGKRPRDC